MRQYINQLQGRDEMNPKLASGRFYGETLKMNEVAGFGLTETIYPPYFQIPQHSHERPYFGFVLGGTYTETYGHKSRTCKPSMLIYHPSDEVHSQRFYQTGTRLFRIEVCPQWLKSLNERVPIQNRPADFHNDIVCRL